MASDPDTELQVKQKCRGCKNCSCANNRSKDSILANTDKTTGMITNITDGPHFKAWSRYHGQLIENCGDKRFPTAIHGFDTEHATPLLIRPLGALFGFVQQGEIVIADAAGRESVVREGQWFCTKNGGLLANLTGRLARAVVIQRLGFLGLPQVGGPLEVRGRLKYIDRCSDSLLVSPPLKGDACLNHLHFPSGIDQTAHTHPSLRVGMVASGGGHCITPLGRFRLEPGLLFVVPKDGHHKFDTLGEEFMNVVAYHPDSDFGPEHEVHPMVNRTLVDGLKIDNSEGEHAKADTVSGYFNWQAQRPQG
jgi:hypothetical protein